MALQQLSTSDGTVIDYGAVRGPVATIVDRTVSTTVKALFARWSADPTIVIFWTRRAGDPVPKNRILNNGATEPLTPELYPLVAADDADGRALAAGRIRPGATRQWVL